ncbi:MAG: ComEC/Rec2 family competence protein, partial [Planctomycetota bacterium]|nr:ComEC/Rec2 family competence protein [Planctomycetota bacterium]
MILQRFEWLRKARGSTFLLGCVPFASELPTFLLVICPRLKALLQRHCFWAIAPCCTVLHVLAISGQHLAILGGTLAWLLRALRFKPASIAFMVTLFLLVYALLTGGRPSAMRAVIMVGCFSLGIILRRPAPAIHTLTASWIILAFIQPWDLFSPGCTLSFLATGCLIWVIPKFSQQEESPLEILTHESKPLWRRMLADFLKATRELFFISAIVWVFVTPLATAFTHVVSPVALLIGPPLIILTTIALLAGFIGIVLGS